MAKKKFKSIVALLCILIIVVCASVIFLPHTHDCIGPDCALCALIETSQKAIICLLISAALHQSTVILFAVFGVYHSVSFLINSTPVALKVKLSD